MMMEDVSCVVCSGIDSFMWQQSYEDQSPGSACSQVGQLKRYMDSFRINLKTCDISASSPWLRTDPSGGNFSTSRLSCSMTITWMSTSVIGSNGKTAAPILQEWTMPATSVLSVDKTAVPLSDYSLTSQNVVNEICRLDDSVHEVHSRMEWHDHHILAECRWQWPRSFMTMSAD